MMKEYLFAYKCSIFCIILIWILCLMPVPEVPELEDIPFMDKWTHFVMYGGTCSVIWLEYLLRHRQNRDFKRVLVWAVIAPDVMSGLLELLQAYCTGGTRSGDWWDYAANSVGVLIGAAIGWFILRNAIKIKKVLPIALILFFGINAAAQDTARPPIMGWASWNNYRVGINEQIVRSQAEAMSRNGMKEAGYQYINTDDGFFGGRDAVGKLLHNQQRFPSGMRALSDYIHSLGLKAGIYTDAGINTCGSHWDKDTVSVGCGLYGHDKEDLNRYLVEWNFDFIKVDWCGGDWLGLDEETRYTEISRQIYALRPDAVFNVCRWMFPGKWVTRTADSWRISGDISASFESIANIIDLNADLWPYCSPGHYNDMDMLQVGRGMTQDEDRAHFSMWCMMVSPLLAGNDLTTMSRETLEILTNRDMIAINQDPLFYQARRLRDDGDLELWGKPLRHTMSGEVAVALLNRSEQPQDIPFQLSEVGIDASKGYSLRNVWQQTDRAVSREPQLNFTVPAHGVVVLKIKGTSVQFNPFQKK